MKQETQFNMRLSKQLNQDFTEAIEDLKKDNSRITKTSSVIAHMEKIVKQFKLRKGI
jgi:hypothetical protein